PVPLRRRIQHCWLGALRRFRHRGRPRRRPRHLHRPDRRTPPHPHPSHPHHSSRVLVRL
ncbi:hypothetical protein CH063_06015, partial [Colletotrichum higginsianum]